jgi:hypothetical protein
MQRAPRLLMGLTLLVILSACNGSGPVTPTAPSPSQTAPSPAPPTPPPPSALSGDITIGSISPGSGATLAVHDCRAGSFTRICTDEWRGTFDVVLDREMPYPVLTVTFYDGPTPCGYAAGTREVVTAGSRVSFSMSPIYLSDEFGTFVQPCRLPATTTRIVAELWSDADGNGTLIQEFANTYTFVLP